MSISLSTSRPLVSSPLASPLASPTAPTRQPSRPLPTRKPSFPTSRPLRPFASIAPAAPGTGKKPVKIIEPPKNFSGGCFVLNLTQAELSRQD
ncbi:hypothetical protein BC834DRAFT_817962 [Gloeopeniophorella convolvens]|nr:hypothetical protein BC834DRAFT_817962 [Gloeopeniophorella convolvens]